MIKINYIKIESYKKQFVFNLQTIMINIGQYQGDSYMHHDEYFSLYNGTMFMNFKKPKKMKNYFEIKKYLEDSGVEPGYCTR